jgi:cation transport ATPase
MPQAKTSTDDMSRDENLNGPKLVSVPGYAHEHEHEHQREHEAHPDYEGEHGHEHGHIERFDLIRIAVTAIAAALVWFRVWEPFPQVSLIGIAGVLFGGWPIFHEAFENLRERRMTMELSMTIALLAALGIGEFFTALIITAFVLAAEVLEGLTVGRGRRAIGDLLAMLPRSAWVVRGGGVARGGSCGRTSPRRQSSDPARNENPR